MKIRLGGIVAALVSAVLACGALALVPVVPAASAFGSEGIAAAELRVGDGKAFKVFNSGGSPCGIDTDGYLWCWGKNYYGSVGNGASGPTADQAHPVRVGGALATSKVTKVAGAASPTCAITVEHHLYCWGAAYVGNGTTSNAALPVRINGGSIGTKDVIDVDSSAGVACAITADGAAHCWGTRAYGRVTGATAGTALSPVAVTRTGALSGATLTQISVGSAVCAVDTDWVAYCWGRGDRGQTGNSTLVETNPAPIKTYNTDSEYRKISGDGDLTCALTNFQAVYCWGSMPGGAGWSGDATDASQAIPKRIKSSGEGDFMIADVSVSSNHVCVLDVGGGAWCTGMGTSGQLGDGGRTTTLAPVKVVDEGVFRSEVASVWVGLGQSCVLDVEGYRYCWGGLSGQGIGNASTAGSAVPVRVQHPW